MSRTVSRCLLAVLLAMVIFGVTSCSTKPTGDPVDAVEHFFSLIASGDFEGAYRSESSMTIGTTTKEHYVLWRRLEAMNMKYTLVSATLGQELTDHTVGSTKYDYAAEVKIELAAKHLPTGLDSTEELTITLVGENRTWKMALPPRSINQLISGEYYWVGVMYLLGTGRPTDFAEAARTFELGIEADQANPLNHLGLGHARKSLKLYTEALAAYRTCVSLCDAQGEDYNFEKAQALFSAGTIYEMNLADRKTAIEYYRASLEALPDNAYAKEALLRLTGEPR